MTTICGHDRETLRRAIELHELRESHDMVGFMMATRGTGQQTLDAYEALRDPAKLAAIIAESMRERGIGTVSAERGSCGANVPRNNFVVWFGGAANPNCIRIDPAGKKWFLLELAQARAFALALLDSPHATIADIERIIGELS